jgi:TrmH family RNA methyltransferase
MRWKKYDRAAPYGYAFGVFPTLELLRYQAKFTEEVLLHSAGQGNEGMSKIQSLCQTARIPCKLDDRLVERLSPKENTYAVGVFKKYRPALHPHADHAVLVSPADMGNLGTALRTMAGFGVVNLAIIRPAADAFDPRVVRASMGALFQVHFAYYEHFEEYRAAFPHLYLYPFMTDGRLPLDQAQFESPFALVFGNESAGLPESFRALGTSIYIPQRATIDSLNLSVALGIALYAATRGRW